MTPIGLTLAFMMDLIIITPAEMITLVAATILAAVITLVAATAVGLMEDRIDD
jgi:hypothetical protein